MEIEMKTKQSAAHNSVNTQYKTCNGSLFTSTLCFLFESFKSAIGLWIFPYGKLKINLRLTS